MKYDGERSDQLLGIDIGHTGTQLGDEGRKKTACINIVLYDAEGDE